MENKFTPGPWIAGGTKPYKGNESYIFDTSVPQRLVCQCHGSLDFHTPPLEEQWFNSALIAAAPDLLEALEEMVEALTVAGETGGFLNYDARNKAVAAIKKAKGQ